ncbi:general secretion pathway protein D [Granulicella aggregans]|uniref:General secretion pathway protein D n=1 Tax=Granulicella aggregans TaxID=474949 RepID=A0A7W7ZH60_9BACT|nr:cohesin domain-containing protein [Granulicella aggregans]MBB5059859.1 general secretion pathway protein D [Granulicella aggregans]
MGRWFSTHLSRRLPVALGSLPSSLLIVGGLALTVGLSGRTAQGQSASSWNKRGQAAEARQDFDAAFEDYKKAYTKAPKDIRYKTRYENVRFKAGAAHVDRGRVYLQGGDSGAALMEFTRALEIDPGNQTAQQEIDIIRNPKAAAPPPSSGPNSRRDETQQKIGSVSGIVELKPVSNDPITLHMVEDTKVIYQAIGKAAGLNVLFDPDYTSKRIPVDLTTVTLSDALRIVGTISNTFYKPVTTNTIFVAANTRQKRTDLDEMAVQTFYLSNTSTANDATEVLTAIRNLLDPSVKIFLVATQNAIVMRATPDQLLLAQKLLNDLDRAKPEVVVDVAVLEVNRDRIRQLGIQLPQSFGASVTNTSTTSSSSSSSTSSGTATTSGTTLNTLAHLTGNNVAVTIGSAEVDAMLSDADTRVLQNPRIRASDGQRATLKIGSKIPVATGSYSAGAATGLTSGIGVQTQFTYLDVGVNIDMTPTVHLDRDVTLKMKVEVSSHTSDVTISGVTEPIISQRVAEQVIQLKDGEPSVLAGIMTQQDSLSVNGTPGLGELPLLKYFFGSRKTEKQQDEIVFLLIPHIVRESVLSRLNTRAIDTGTSQSIELHREGGSAVSSDSADADAGPSAIQPASTVTAASAAAAMVHPTPQKLNSNLPSDLPQTTAPIGAGGIATAPPGGPFAQAAIQAGARAPIQFTIDPANNTQPVGSTFQTSVMLTNAEDVFAVPLQLQFNPAVLQLVNVDSGPFLGSDGQAVALAHRDEGNGLVALSARRPPNTKGISGQGTVCILTFKALAAGDSPITMVKVGASDSKNVNIPATGSQAVVHVK